MTDHLGVRGSIHPVAGIQPVYPRPRDHGHHPQPNLGVASSSGKNDLEQGQAAPLFVSGHPQVEVAIPLDFDLSLMLDLAKKAGGAFGGGNPFATHLLRRPPPPPVSKAPSKVLASPPGLNPTTSGIRKKKTVKVNTTPKKKSLVSQSGQSPNEPSKIIDLTSDTKKNPNKPALMPTKTNSTSSRRSNPTPMEVEAQEGGEVEGEEFQEPTKTLTQSENKEHYEGKFREAMWKTITQGGLPLPSPKRPYPVLPFPKIRKDKVHRKEPSESKEFLKSYAEFFASDSDTESETANTKTTSDTKPYFDATLALLQHPSIKVVFKKPSRQMIDLTI